MTNNKVNEKIYPIYIYYNQYSTGGEIRAGEEDEAWPSHDDEYRTFEITSVSLLKDLDNWYREEVHLKWEPLQGETVYILVARYQSGGTFIKTHGNFHICGVFKTEEEWIKRQELLESDIEKIDDEHLYKPWIGYFERLECFEMYDCVIGSRDSQLQRTNKTKRFKV